MLEYKKNGRIKYKRGQSAEDRFWDKVSKTDSCWLWLGKPTKEGYGSHVVMGKTLKAHRFSYELHKGKIEEGLLVRHTCDNPSCVNPDHLIVGNSQNNAQDREGRGRNGVPRGSASHLSKLDESTVLIIRWLKKRGLSLGKIAKLYHLHSSSVWGIVNRRSWQHLPEEKYELPIIFDERTQYEVTVTVREIREKSYQIVVPANDILEANTKALNLNPTKIHNEGWHTKGADTKEVYVQVINIRNPNDD